MNKHIILAELIKGWRHDHRDLRFGQWLWALCGKDPFSVEDDDMVELVLNTPEELRVPSNVVTRKEEHKQLKQFTEKWIRLRRRIVVDGGC